MARFRLNQTVTTREPFVQVDAGLEPGTYRFRLVVVDEQGNRSQPAFADVVVRERRIVRGGGGVVVGPR